MCGHLEDLVSTDSQLRQEAFPVGVPILLMRRLRLREGTAYPRSHSREWGLFLCCLSSVPRAYQRRGHEVQTPDVGLQGPMGGALLPQWGWPAQVSSVGGAVLHYRG